MRLMFQGAAEMNRRLSVALTVASAGFALFSSAALTQTISLKDQTGGVTRGVSSIADFSGSWAHASLYALEPPLSGPGPVRNKSRLSTGPQAGAGNNGQLVGDYSNPILQPWAAAVVKKFGEVSLAGKGFPTPRNQCWPEGMPFVFLAFGMQILQQSDKITILYPFDHQFRQV